jgi:hypothetical protein
MEENKEIIPESGASSERDQAQVLDGILESAIGGELLSSETPTPTDNIAAVEHDTEESEVQPDPSADTVKEGQEEEAEVSLEADEESVDDSDPKHISAPKTWPKEQREAFEALPEDQQSFMLKREKERDAAFTRKTSELAEQRKEAQSVLDVVKPYETQMRANGIQPEEYIARLMTYDQALRQNPKQTIEHLAQHYGVNLKSNESGVDQQPLYQEPVDPQYQQLQQQLDEQGKYLRSMQESQQNAQYSELVGKVEGFANEKSSSGELKHPHFEKLRERMGRLVNAGEAKDLKQAYNMALRLDEDLYKEAIQSERKAVATKEEERRKVAVEKAKRAKPSSSGSPPRGSVKQSGLDDLLRDSIASI